MALPWQNAHSPISSRMPSWSVQSLTALKDLQFIKCPYFSGTRPQAVLSHYSVRHLRRHRNISAARRVISVRAQCRCSQARTDFFLNLASKAVVAVPCGSIFFCHGSYPGPQACTGQPDWSCLRCQACLSAIRLKIRSEGLLLSVSVSWKRIFPLQYPCIRGLAGLKWSCEAAQSSRV